MDKSEIKRIIESAPIYQYALVPIKQVTFSEKVRQRCKSDCPFYRTSWSCPPAVIKADKCRVECERFEGLLAFTTVHEKKTPVDEKMFQKITDTHEEITANLREELEIDGLDTFVLTSGKCNICPKCSFPGEYCRHPDLMRPCIESNGINVMELFEKYDMDYFSDDDNVLMISFVFYRHMNNGEEIDEQQPGYHEEN